MRLYNRHNEFVGIVINPAKRVIKQNLGGMHYFEWEVPVSNPAWDKIELEGYVVVQGHGRFTIKEKVTHGTSCSVKCIMSVDEIIGSAWNNFHSRGNNITDTFKLLLDGTGWTAINHSNNTEVRNCYGNNVSSWDMLQRVCNIYQIECEFDTLNKYVTIKDKIGTDSGTLFISRLNLKQMKTDSHSHNMVTKLKPIGKDGLTIANVNGGSDWITNFTYTDKVMEAIWEQTRYEDAQSLKDDAVKYLAELAIPYEVYEVDVVDLGRLNTHQHLVYGIGDIVTIREQDQKLNVKQRIVYNEIWIDDMGQNKINVANKDMSFEDYYKRLQLLSESLANTVNEDGTIATDKVNIPQGDLDISSIPDKSITGIKIKDGAIEASHIKSESIQTRHLVSGSVTADIISAGAISSRHLAVGAVGANNIQAGAITAGSAIIANGAIGSAQIGNIDAGKITSGSFNTDFIQIGSTTQKFLIDKETLQIKDANNTVRVQIGKTGTGTNDYSMSLWDAQGHLMFDASGLQEDGIKSGIIRNDMVSDTANINGSKLNIASVITKINDDTSTTFKASKITLDGANQTLDVAFTQINNTQTSQGTQISNIQSSINGITTTVGNLQTDNTSMKSEISQIKQEAGVISSSVTQINQKFDNLQFGGRNKVLRSKTFEKTHWYPQDNQVTEGWSFYQDEDGSTVAKVKNTDGVGHLASLYCERMFGTKGDTNTISFEVKCPSWADVSQDVLMGMIYEEYRDSTGGGRIYYDDVYFSSNDSNKPTLVDNKWIKFSYTKQVQNEDTKWISFRLILYKNGELHFKLPKMEDGTVATAWSPAPEDLEVDLSGYAQVDFVRSEITQSAKDIKLEVSNSYTTKTDFNNLKIGGRNLALKSHEDKANNSYNVATYDLSPYKLADNEKVTIQIKGTMPDSKGSWGIWNTDWSTDIGFIDKHLMVNGVATGTFNWKAGTTDSSKLLIFSYPDNGETANTTIDWVKIERGSKATDWTPAPEDTDSKIDNLKVGGRNLWIKHTSKSGWLNHDNPDGSDVSPAGAEDRVTDFIKIDPTKKYIFQLWGTATGNSMEHGCIFGFYDAHKVWISSSDVGFGREEYYKRETSNIPANAGYMRISARYAEHSLCKFEEGDLASDWTPAPEDIDFKFNDYTTTVDMDTKISLEVGKITQSVTATYVTKSDYNTKVSELDSKITQTATDITSTVSANYTSKDEFNKLTIGGRNHFKKTSPYNGWNGATGSKNETHARNGLQIDYTGHDAGAMRISEVINSNGEWTVSGYIFSTVDQARVEVQIADIHAWSSTLGNTAWTRFEGTVNVTNFSQDVFNFVDVEAYGVTGSIYIVDLKVEKGNKATEWTPAPEDMEVDLTGYAKEDFVTSKVNQSAGEIRSEVSAGYTTKTEFNNLSIGTRNLIKGTKDFVLDGSKGFTDITNSHGSISKEGDFGVGTISTTGLTAPSWTSYRSSNYPVNPGEYVTFSFYVKVADLDAWDNKLVGSIDFFDDTWARVQWFDIDARLVVTEPNKWFKITHTAKSDKPNIVHGYVQFFLAQNGTVSFKMGKVEYGNRASDWSPAPEDMENKLGGYYTKVETDSQISQTATNITSTVSNTYTTKTDFNTQVSAINSKIDQSASSIRLEVTSAKNDAINSANASTDDKLSKVAVGGTNLFYNTRDFDRADIWDFSGKNIESDKINGFGYVKLTDNWQKRSQIVDVEPNTEYTISAWVRRSTAEETEPTRVGFYIPGYPPNETQDGTIVKTHNYVNNDIFPPNVWKRIGVTYRTGANTTKCCARFEPMTDNFNDHKPSMWMYGLKLEKGNVMTDWSPNPDDLELYPSGRNLWKWSTAVTGWEQGGTYVENAYELQHKIQPDLTPIDPKKKLFVQVWNPNKIANSANSQRICWYNADKAFISSVPVTQLDGSEYIVDMYTPPALARYTRLAVIVGSVEAKQIDPGIKVMIENADVKGEWSIAPEDIDSNFKDMEVGGRNFLVGSKLTTYEDYNQIQTNVNSEAIVCIWNPSHTGNTFTLGITGWIPPKGTYTLSGYVLLAGAVPKDKFFTERANYEVGGDYETYYDSTTGYFEITQEYNGTSPWVLHAHTTRVGGAVGFVTLKKLKFEKGNKATDWTQAPEDTDERVTKAEASITVLKDQIIHKVEVDDVKSVIQQNPDSVRIGFNGITNNVEMASTGITINNGALVLKNRAGQSVLSADANGNLLMNCWGTTFHMSATGARGHDMSCDVNDCLNWVIDDTNMGSGIKIKTVSNKTLFEFHPLNSSNGDDGFIWMGVWTKMSTLSVTGDQHVGGDFTVGGAKHCVVETENYGTRKLYAYETAESYFGDIGDAVIGDDGIVVVDIEDIFSECVTLDKYHVFTQCYTGNISKITRHPAYFTVEGEPGTEFSWELKAKRKGYESDRLGEFKKEEKFYGQ